MPANYNGVVDAAIVPGSTITITQPVDGDNLTAASANVATARLADLLKTVIDNTMWKGSPTVVTSPVTVGTGFAFTSQQSVTWSLAGYALKGTANHASGKGLEGDGGLVGVSGLTSLAAGSGVKGFKNVFAGGFFSDRGAVWGDAVSASGNIPVGVLGTAQVTDGSGTSYGVYGRAGSLGAGVLGIGDPSVTATNGVAHGVQGETKGNDGVNPSAGVRGMVTGGSAFNRGGWFSSTSGTGVYATGVTAVEASSSAANGIGVSGVGSGSLGMGVVAQGFFGLVADSLTAGGYAVWARVEGSAPAGDAAILSWGSVQLDPTKSNPAVGSTTAKNRLTARTIPRTWLVLDCNGTANPGVLGASYGAITQGTGGASGTITVNLPIPMASGTNYFVMIVESGVTSIPALWPVTIVSATQFTAAPVRTLTGAAVTGPECSGKKLFILVFGDQA